MCKTTILIILPDDQFWGVHHLLHVLTVFKSHTSIAPLKHPLCNPSEWRPKIYSDLCGKQHSFQTTGCVNLSIRSPTPNPANSANSA